MSTGTYKDGRHRDSGGLFDLETDEIEIFWHALDALIRDTWWKASPARDNENS
jgi:hypothetical protein